jgi:Flp pilus assembly protein TadD
VATRPTDADARTHLVHVLFRLQRPREALPYALEAARLRPEEPEALADAGALLIGAGRPEEAIPALTHALALRPDFARAATLLALAREAARSRVGYPDGPVPVLPSKEIPH